MSNDKISQQMVDLAEVEDTKLQQKSRHSYSQGQLIRRRFSATNRLSSRWSCSLRW